MTANPRQLPLTLRNSGTIRKAVELTHAERTQKGGWLRSLKHAFRRAFTRLRLLKRRLAGSERQLGSVGRFIYGAGQFVWRLFFQATAALQRLGGLIGYRVKLFGRTLWDQVYRQRIAIRQSGDLPARFAWWVVTSPPAERLLLSAAPPARSKPRQLSRIIFALSEYALVAATAINLGAGHSERAIHLARLLNLLFRPLIKARKAPAIHVYFETLYRCQGLARIVRDYRQPLRLANHHLDHVVGVAHLFAGDSGLAEFYLKQAIAKEDSSYIDYRYLGRVYLRRGLYSEAQNIFEQSVKLNPRSVMAHQNYAGRYDIETYEPAPWELSAAGELLVLDNLHQLAEDYILLGRFDDGFEYYQKAMDYQAEIAVGKSLPQDIARLASDNTAFNPHLPVRILPYEWVAQFGHIGLLDSYQKMVRLGMYPKANYVVLAPAKKVPNETYLGYWDEQFIIVRDPELVDALFPYQRYFGDNFMALRSNERLAEPWTRQAARAHAQWAEHDYPPLLKLRPSHDEQCRAILHEEMGVPENAWYVGLHAREGGFHHEPTRSMSQHRNARITDYIPSIEEITKRGGWVIRLGDHTMKPLPEMPQVVDYAHSPQKSEAMDIFLLATSRFVIGTTSGVTTVALSFDTPTLLVNCISNDWQLWSKKTHFTIKRIMDRRYRRFLSLSEIYRPPLQGYLINNLVLNRRGYIAVENSIEEITEAVRYKLDVLDGLVAAYEENDPAVIAYRKSLAHEPHMFGAALPVLPFLQRNPHLTDNGGTANSANSGKLRENLSLSHELGQ